MGTLGIKMDRDTAIQATSSILREIYKVHTELGIDNILVSGSMRRGKLENIGDIDIILVTLSGEIDKRFSKYLSESINFNIDASGPKLVRGITDTGIQFDFYSCSEDQLPFMMAYLTGPQEFNIGMRSQARKLGYKLNQLGIMDAKTGLFISGIQNEAQLFYLLGCNYINPSDRTNWYQNFNQYKLNK